MGWYRRLVARKFDGSKSRRYPGRPRIDNEIEQLVVRMAKENSDWGYDRIAGAMANLGYRLSDQTVGNILQRQWYSTGTRASAHDDLGRLYPCAPICPGRYRLFLGGGTDAAWFGHLLRAVLYPSGEPSR